MAKKNMNAALAEDVSNAVNAIKGNESDNNATAVGEGGSRKKYDAVKVKAEAEPLIKGIDGVSAKIRKLASAGWERGKIAVALDKRYQHVRNVLTSPVKAS